MSMHLPRHLLFVPLLALSLPALAFGATWNPDPSLGNPDQHRRLYEIARTYAEKNFDPDANLVGVPTHNPPNKKNHSVRESGYYAFALLLTGDPEDNTRAQAIIKQILANQEARPGNPNEGVFKWVDTDPAPVDLNSAEFVGLILANITDLDRKKPCLDPALRAQIEAAGRLAVKAAMRRDVDPGYTNISFLSIALGAAGEKLWSVPGAGAFAQAKLDTVMTLAGGGEFYEYNCPTYTAVDIDGAYTARKYAFNDAFAAKADAAIDHLWQLVAASYHAPTFQISGPFCRSYGEDMLQYASALKYLLYLALDGAYPLPDVEISHEWDKAGIGEMTTLPIGVRPEFKVPQSAWREFTATGPVNSPVRKLYQYKDGIFTLGTVANQDEWVQKRNLAAYWRCDASTPQGFRVGYCLEESNESLPRHFPYDQVHFVSQQQKGAAVVALVSCPIVAGQGECALIFDPAATVAEGDAPGGPTRILDGSITTYLYPITTNGGHYEGKPDYQGKPDIHFLRVTRSWSSSDVIGPFHVLSYLVVFRPSDQPAPVVSDLVLKANDTDGTASATVDGAPLSVSFKKW